MTPPSRPDVPAALHDWVLTVDSIGGASNVIEALASKSVSEGSLRVAANRGRLNANKGSDGNGEVLGLGSTSTWRRGRAAFELEVALVSERIDVIARIAQEDLRKLFR